MAVADIADPFCYNIHSTYTHTYIYKHINTHIHTHKHTDTHIQADTFSGRVYISVLRIDPSLGIIHSFLHNSVRCELLNQSLIFGLPTYLKLKFHSFHTFLFNVHVCVYAFVCACLSNSLTSSDF